MAKVGIIYWSGTGNTEAMANLISDGIVESGNEATVINVSEATVEDVDKYDVLALGCPSMGDEVLEESEFEPYIESIEAKLSGKKVGLFGSYGWGNGEWMEDFDKRMENAGAVLVVDSLIVNDTPEGENADACKNFGKTLIK